MQATKPCATEWAYAERRVRELLGKGWARSNIVVRVSHEIRQQRNTIGRALGGALAERGTR